MASYDFNFMKNGFFLFVLFLFFFVLFVLV